MATTFEKQILDYIQEDLVKLERGELTSVYRFIRNLLSELHGYKMPKKGICIEFELGKPCCWEKGLTCPPTGACKSLRNNG